LRKVLTLLGAVFVGYLAISLLAGGLDKHSQDGGSHLDMFIGGAVFAVIALAVLAQALGMIPGRKVKTLKR
jgi:hypothetical protein